VSVGLISPFAAKGQKADSAKLYGPIRRVNLKLWLFTSPDRVPGVAITSA